ncbi:uncharacterized protein si:dkeyp-117h8.4 [Mugil cephalus]|uniref:uncharacterized protein si:dkeyp-117h8.4 n=1 Tax=Mugil cephalus TaxID=48193 RepID=UPI001FB63726|nr:uncharacterized protein si:dkeyp-117h8.4 [Mugil cephalus]
MDVHLKRRLCENGINYKRALDRIVDKYSKVQHQDAGIDVDLESINPRKLDSFMEQSRMILSQLESKSQADWRERSLQSQDITGDSRLELTYQDEGDDETSRCSGQFYADDYGKSSVSSEDDSRSSFSQVELQPEDEDEELQMSLSSHGNSLVELYPSTISRIGRAWHRQHLSEAATSVLRRYRRWRRQSNRSSLNSTFDVTLRRASVSPTQPTPKVLVMDMSRSPEERQHTPGKERGSLMREQHRRDRVETPLRKNYTVSQPSPSKPCQPGKQGSLSSVSPSRLYCHAAKAPVDSPLRPRRLSLSALSAQAAGCSARASETASDVERSDIYGSPVRQSPSKLRVMSIPSRSPHAFSNRSREYSVEGNSRAYTSPQTLSTALQRPIVPLRRLHSPQSAPTADIRQRRRRHLSFDSYLPQSPAPYSPKKVDEDFLKVYHKFVCQSKSMLFNAPPCSLCARSSDTSSGPSSSALASLALSPHRSALRKRYRELDECGKPQSKRFREKYCTYSPGSERHRKEMLRRRLIPTVMERPPGGLSSLSSKYAKF